MIIPVWKTNVTYMKTEKKKFKYLSKIGFTKLINITRCLKIVITVWL